MNRHFLAAALACGAAGLAHAQSNITLYGAMDLSAAYERNGAGHVRKLESGVMNGSRLGFRGTEDLGGGLSANFTLEMGVNADDGSLGQGGLGFGRQAWVGLANPMGAVRAGRQYTPLYFSLLAIDPFIGGMKGDMTSTRGWFNAGGVRTNNAVGYFSPVWNGLRVSALYGFGEVVNQASAGRAGGFSADYSAGPLNASLSYHAVKNATGTDDQSAWFTGGSYDFGPVRVHAAFDSVRGFANAKVRDTMLGLTVPVATGKIVASVLHKDNRVVADADARQWSAGYVHNLSTRTVLYTSYAQVHNQRNAAVASGGVNGASDKVIDLGIRHFF